MNKRATDDTASEPAKRARLHRCHGPYSERHKFCYCDPTCQQLLRPRQRREHRSQAEEPGLIPPSETDSQCSCVGDSSDSDSDLDAAAPAVSSSRVTSPSSGSSPSASSRQPLDECPSSSESDGGRDDYSDSYDLQEDADEILSEEDMIAELATMLVSDHERLMWELRKRTSAAGNMFFTEYAGDTALTEQDRDNIRLFVLKMISNMPRFVFNLLRESFSHKMDLDSKWVIAHQIAIMSGVQPEWYDCCLNSCMAYTGEYSELDECLDCATSRWREDNGESQRKFCYIPLIPRLQGYFSNPERVEELLYPEKREDDSETLSDAWDGELIAILRKLRVVVDGQKMPYCYFNSKYDLAFAFAADSYLLYDRCRDGSSATPMLVSILNLPPAARTHLHDLECLGVIPGPKPPKRMHTYTHPFDVELAMLARGVETYNAHSKKKFPMRGYCIMLLMDMVAAHKALNTKGQNGKCPCRACEILATLCRAAFSQLKQSHYYSPLAKPEVDDVVRRLDPTKIKKRSEKSFRRAIGKLNAAAAAGDEAYRKVLASHYGINGEQILRRVESLLRPMAYPHDLMHLFFENIIPNLIKLWSGKFATVDTRNTAYFLSERIWALIWRETSDAVATIPSAFSRSLAGAPERFNAEAWCFWFLYLAPALLRNRLPDAHYQHMCKLGDIIKFCLQWSIRRDDLDWFEGLCIEWVQEYEELYYGYSEENMPVCTLTIHAVLHVADDIRFCGPGWVTWTFFVERFCGFLKLGLRGKRFPWAALNNRVLNFARLSQMGVRYDLKEELALFRRDRSEKLTRFEVCYPEYPRIILRAPRFADYILPPLVRDQVAAYLSQTLRITEGQAKLQVPSKMIRWGKVRIRDGDHIRAYKVFERGDQGKRDNTYFLKLKPTARSYTHILSYGRLDQILECVLPEADILGDFSGTRRLLACITPCHTSNRDASEDVVGYATYDAALVVDVASISAVVGRIETRGSWYIVDRTAGLIKPELVPCAEEGEDDQGAEADDERE
uniref:Uncharacterized protein n=1 Tax=Mycena chlorophos TaxID=658473 RepID=A0ABQ0KY34_MYCCL|nr:predicted protein [Mycena chlorophos]